MARHRGFLFLLLCSGVFLSGYMSYQDKQYLEHMVRVHASELFQKRQFNLNTSDITYEKGKLKMIKLSFSAYRGTTQKQARELILTVANELITKLNKNKELQSRGVFQGHFCFENLDLEIRLDNVFSKHVDPASIRVVRMAHGFLEYETYKNSPHYLTGKQYIKESYEDALVFLGKKNESPSRVFREMRNWKRKYGEKESDEQEEVAIPQIQEVQIEEYNLLLPPVIEQKEEKQEVQEEPAPIVEEEVVKPPVEEAPVEPFQEAPEGLQSVEEIQQESREALEPIENLFSLIAQEQKAPEMSQDKEVEVIEKEPEMIEELDLKQPLELPEEILKGAEEKKQETEEAPQPASPEKVEQKEEKMVAVAEEQQEERKIPPYFKKIFQFFKKEETSEEPFEVTEEEEIKPLIEEQGEDVESAPTPSEEQLEEPPSEIVVEAIQEEVAAQTEAIEEEESLETDIQEEVAVQQKEAVQETVVAEEMCTPSIQEEAITEEEPPIAEEEHTIEEDPQIEQKNQVVETSPVPTIEELQQLEKQILQSQEQKEEDSVSDEIEQTLKEIEKESESVHESEEFLDQIKEEGIDTSTSDLLKELFDSEEDDDLDSYKEFI